MKNALKNKLKDCSAKASQGSTGYYYYKKIKIKRVTRNIKKSAMAPVGAVLDSLAL